MLNTNEDYRDSSSSAFELVDIHSMLREIDRNGNPSTDEGRRWMDARLKFVRLFCRMFIFLILLSVRMCLVRLSREKRCSMRNGDRLVDLFKKDRKRRVYRFIQVNRNIRSHANPIMKMHHEWIDFDQSIHSCPLAIKVRTIEKKVFRFFESVRLSWCKIMIESFVHWDSLIFLWKFSEYRPSMLMKRELMGILRSIFSSSGLIIS